MREFFHGWRRKVGCVTLVMACMASLLWYRSIHVGDRLVILSIVAVSQAGEFSVGPTTDTTPLSFKSEVLNAIHQGTWPGGARYTITSIRWKHSEPVVPYWPLVLPLTLLSAYLILWQPRKRT